MIGRPGPLLFALAAVLIAGAGCEGCSDPPIIDDTFDGNVVIGDATPAPDATRDAAPDADATETSTDTDGGDGGEVDPDGEVPDAADSGIDAGIDCTPEVAETISATTAVADAERLANLFVEITGTATATALACTACADAGSCTCTCTATAAIDGLVALARSECFDSPGCAGDECRQVCRPPILGTEQRFRGRLNVRNSGPEKSVALELFSVSP
jgi:hypothetical protein